MKNKKKGIHLLLTISCVFCCLVSFAQSTTVAIDDNQNSPGVNWQVIQTERFNIIFPSEILKDARRVANTMEYIYDSVAKTMSFKPGKYTILLTNQTTIANGFVTTIPRYSQWYSTPPQMPWGGAVEWYNTLATHETRHMIQMDKFRSTGWNPLIHFLFGQTVFTVLMNYSIPGWFFEGDAVGTETALTNGGRGRLPEFDRDIRTLLLSGKKYSFTKAYMNSVKDYYPSIYELGYQMTTYVKRKYGPNAWSNILKTASKVEYLPFSFGIATKGNIKESNKMIYINSMNELEKLWKEQLNGLTFTEGKKINLQAKKSWTNYEFPQYAEDGSVICYKWGKDDIIKLIKIDKSGNETFLCYGPQYSGIPFRVCGHYIIWNEIQWDKRWGQQDFSLIRIYDLNSGKKRTLVSHSKLFSPEISPDMNRVVAVEFTKERKCAIVVLDFNTGKELKRFNYDSKLVQMPSWSKDCHKIVYTVITAGDGSLMEMIDYETGMTTDIFPSLYENFAKPVFAGKYVLYNSPYSGIDNIYAVEISSLQKYQVTSRKFASSNPCISPDGTKILFNDYTVDGFDILEMPFSPDSFQPILKVDKKNIRYWEPLVKQESHGNVLKNIPNKDLPAKKYKTAAHLFNIHSWYFLPGLVGKNISVSVNSVNYLNNMLFKGNYVFNRNEKTNSLSLSGSYGGWFPLIDFGGIAGGRTSNYLINDTIVKYYHWHETTAYLGFRIPLNLSYSVYYQKLILSVYGNYTYISGISDFTAIDHFTNANGTFMPVSYRLTFQRALQGDKDFNPKWGQNISLVYNHTPFGGDYKGKMLSGQADLYFPGLFRHHSFWIQFAGEIQPNSNYHFASEFLYPRGYSFQFHNKLYKTGINYGLPLWYPDIHLGPVINFRQLRINIFDDYGIGINDISNPIRQIKYNSAGMELIACVNFLQLPYPVEIGIRYNYLTSEKRSNLTFAFFGFGL